VECAEFLLHWHADIGEQHNNDARRLRQHQVAVFPVHVVSVGAAVAALCGVQIVRSGKLLLNIAE
jgi:hypothetical protein